MKTIESNVKNEFIINKSRFITFLYKVNNIDEVNFYLNDIKKTYKDATHHCYAYKLNNIKRFYDDSEPNGTAGMPILNVLENNDLNYILCIVVRYFGGIKLGTGGLIRAYNNSVVKALDECIIKELIKNYKIMIKFKYDNVKTIDNLIRNYKIIKKDFNELITYELLVDDIEIINNLKNICEIKILDELYI